MAISEDTAAIVAAQLTVAWAQVYAQRTGASGLNPDNTAAKIVSQYDAFRQAVREKDIPLI